ncbi:immunoglobulin domain-containing protein [Butyricimonas synergistica]|uniref:immunoglobulin domain-containing protein n=1 Tax=Butyricimonas synergistica TaxID=544644 RepID=UPI0003683D3A|nr:immunoglobulin domain-containing protein [Butyricimonas synergistica]
MKKMMFLICALFFVLTGFNQQERIVEQGRVEILESVSDVSVAPVILVELRDFTAKEGGVAVFDARFEPVGDPKLTAEWFYNGKPLPDNSRMRTYLENGYATLVINPVYAEDAGVYTLKISNALGEVRSSARLYVTK